MKRATVTLPDDLAGAVEGYIRSHAARPPFTAVVQAALRHYLGDRGYLKRSKPLEIRPAIKGSGRRDVSRAHDRYLAKPSAVRSWPTRVLSTPQPIRTMPCIAARSVN
jgi:hypothetical protein